MSRSLLREDVIFLVNVTPTEHFYATVTDGVTTEHHSQKRSRLHKPDADVVPIPRDMYDALKGGQD